MKSKDSAEAFYLEQRIQHWDQVALRLNHWQGIGVTYQRQLSHLYQFHVPPGQRVMEIGCGTGELLAGLKPAFGVGVDFSAQMLKRANHLYPDLHFVQADAHALPIGATFDAIILSDLVNDVWDVQCLFENLHSLCHQRTRLILNTYSLVWEPLLKLAQGMGLSKPNLIQNWLTVDDIMNLLSLSGFEVIHHQQEILLPLPIPLLATLANRFLVKLWPFSLLAVTNLIISRPIPRFLRQTRSQLAMQSGAPTVSVIVPARNEAGNINSILERMPEMGSMTEIIFIEGHSRDNTFQTIEQAIPRFLNQHCSLYRQDGKGKGDAVRLGFQQAKGDILMILDADLTVLPEDLPRFYEVLVSGKGDFVNGVRLVYPVEDQSMRFLNLAANKFFSLAFTWLLGHPVKDTLCGTKALWKRDYQLIAANRAYFGDFDPFGDFDLLFGATKLNLKIIDMPIRYRSRTYGSTNIDRWRHGWLLLKMVTFAARRIKFV